MEKKDYEDISPEDLIHIHIPRSAGRSVEAMLRTAKIPYYGGKHRFVCPTHNISDYKYFTLLRHPVARVWSDWSIMQIEIGGYSKDDFLKYVEDHSEVRNWAAMAISGIDAAKTKCDDNELLKAAKKNIDKFWFYGTHENLSASIKSLFDKIGVPMPKIEHVKSSHSDEIAKQPSPKDIEIIKEHNKVDLQLYSYCCARESVHVKRRERDAHCER